ncbi:hypothetical protein M758_3G073700 [Ceratodon purpureus]|nr:hypothetical protein M758_3G073700 [Ceratodon purpureus]
MADGDLASIFRHRQLQPQPVQADQWGSAMGMAMAAPPHAIPPTSSQDSWDYPNSLSPQSPFEYHDQYQRMLQSKSFSSLRPPAPQRGHVQGHGHIQNQGQFHAIPTQVDAAALSRKRDYQGSDYQMRGKLQGSLSSGSTGNFGEVVRIAPGQDSCGPGFQVSGNGGQVPGNGGSYGELGAMPVGVSTGMSGVSSSWTSATDCKVTELATELESEILGDLRPGPGYLADHYPGRLLAAQGNNGNQGGGMALEMQQGGQQNRPGDAPIIKVLDTASSLKMEPKSGGQQANSTTGLQLVHLLLACAEAVANEQMDLAHVVLARLSAMLVPCTTTMQRLGSVFVDALHARITQTATSGRYKGLERDKDVAMLDMLQAFSGIYEFTPFIKLPHLTLNQIILDAVEGEAHIHVIDLNTGWRGMQWPAFIQALALRPGGPPKLRITSIGKSDDLEHSREKLQDYALNLQVPFEFCPIMCDLKAFDVRMVDIRDWEVVCINSVNQFHQLLTWGDDRFHRFLCDLRSLHPRVLAFTENDADHNSSTFLHRFFECLRYYSAVYDALDASLPQGSYALQQVEHLFTGQKIRNIVACEGEDRITRHETLANWSRRMEMAGFRATPIGTRAISQARLLLHLYFAQSGYTLRTENGAVVLGWDNMPLLGATAWRS